MPGALKNAIDWLSRYKPQPFNERHGLLMSASPWVEYLGEHPEPALDRVE
jgi:NAD(P)H-dependent FMN reductase